MEDATSRCGEMTERMRDAFVVQDINGRKDMMPSQREKPMAMGDGTFMADNAFRESVPMMSYTPEELGINMAAYPRAEPAPAPIAPAPVQEATETSPFLAVVQEDEYSGGVQFNADTFVETHSYSILKYGIVALSFYFLGSYYSNRS